MKWQKKRRPEDVPTPIAVALADYCRRTHFVAPASEVREALSFLAETDDFRVRMLTDGEPSSGDPLGPWAVVDMVGGATVETSALRQKCGYYELVKEFCLKQAVFETVSTASAQAAVPLLAPKPLKESSARMSLSEKIAPKKRWSLSQEAPHNKTATTGWVSSRSVPGKDVAWGQSFRDLFQPSGKSVAELHLSQFEHRVAIRESLSLQYAGRGGKPLSLTDVEELYRWHKLLEALQEQEQALLISAYSAHGGSDSKVALSLGMGVSSLRNLVRASGAENAVHEIKDGVKQTLLLEKRLPYRLEMAGRTRYLQDLGIENKYMDLLRKDLLLLLRQEGKGKNSLAKVALAHEMNPESLARTMARLGLTKEIEDYV